jgi:plastocyanin
MAIKYFGVTPNQPLGSPNDVPTSFLWYQGYEVSATFGHPVVVGDASAEPTFLGEDPTLLIDSTDTIIIFDYRSRASFSEAFLSATPDTNSITRIYNVLLNKEPDSGGLSDYSNTSEFPTNRDVIEKNPTGLRLQSEYQNNSSSIFSYPLHILDQNGDAFWRSNNYEAYVDYHQDLLAAYNARSPEDTRTKNQWGSDHFEYSGRGESRAVYAFEPPESSVKFESTSPNVSSIQGLLYLALGVDQTNEYSYTVTANEENTAYLWNGHGLIDAENPSLYFRHGDIVTITNASGGHVMEIVPNNGAAAITESSGVIYANPLMQGNYTYRCVTHPAMTGSIYIGEPYINQGPEDGYGTGLLPTRNTQVGINQIRTKINEIITKGGLGGSSSVTTGTIPPESPNNGDLWFDTAFAELYMYSEEYGAWIQTNGGTGSSTSVGLAAPDNPTEGNLWFNESVGELYVYVDAVGWVQTNTGGAGGGGGGGGGGGATVSTGAEAPADPAGGDLWFNESVGSLFVYIGGTGWVESTPGAGAGVNWESDWVQVPALDSGSNYSILPITHNLQTETPIVQVYVKHLTTGKIQNIGMQHDEETGAHIDSGVSFQPTSLNEGNIKFFENVFGESPDTVGEVNFLVLANSSEYHVKVVANAGNSSTVPILHNVPTGNTVATSGTSTLPGGLIIKFGQGASTGDSQETFTFPSAFPNNHFSTVLNRTDANASLMLNTDSISASGFTINRDNNISGSVGFNFISIGN